MIKLKYLTDSLTARVLNNIFNIFYVKIFEVMTSTFF